jgi:hypothetical protein
MVATKKPAAKKPVPQKAQAQNPKTDDKAAAAALEPKQSLFVKQQLRNKLLDEIADLPS